MTSLECETHCGRPEGERPHHRSTRGHVLDGGSVQIDIGGRTTGGDGVPAYRWRAFALLAVAYFMTIVDLTIVNVALPIVTSSIFPSRTSSGW
jgi:hypothetical protein